MDSVFGVVGGGFAVVAAGTSAAGRSVVFINPDNDRVTSLGSKLLLGVSGVPGDCLRLRDEVRASASKIHSAAAAADVARGAVIGCAQSANAVIAGYDKVEGPTMYAVGGTAPPERVEQYRTAGCGAGLCTTVMENHYRPGMTVKEAVALVDRCIKEVRRLGLASFVIMVVDKDGAREYTRRILRPKAVIEIKSSQGTPIVNSNN
ncbi:hypothetical protein CFC21_073919 [Triticum aestivum]|uniref:Proteasome endopeptidase complex n=2 Tax=Triticum aestivum TaxID=4565 RepID=A0A9R1HMK6_WHEAT|nr:proteasome subunit beta type-2-B-like [Triticum aestivum]KAF7068143.1 hypothetical protein CFC21_073919 [Triticum aestivum]